MQAAGEDQGDLRRTRSAAFPHRSLLRVACMALATCAGSCLGWLLGGPALAWSEDVRAGTGFDLAWGIVLLGSLVAWFGLLVWLALQVEPQARIARPGMAPLFGCVCGLALAGLLLPLAVGGLPLEWRSIPVVLGIGAVTGGTTWTAYVLLARWLAALLPAARSPD